MIIKCFNEKGIDEFRRQLNEIKIGLRKDLDRNILANEELIFSYKENIEIELSEFVTKKDISVYLSNKLNLALNKSLYYDSNLWSWLTAFYFEVVCPKNSSGNRKINEEAKYILTDPKNWRRYYRHLLACSAKLHCELGELANPFLASPIHIWGDFHEQLTAYQSIATNKPLIQAAGDLYWDSKQGKLKKGSGSKGAGTPRRFSDIVGQFELTYDLNAMPSEDILGLFPDFEFKKFNTAA
jgi:hypothetical protein